MSPSATGVGIAAGQGKRAGTALHQAAGATEHTAERGVAVVAAGAQGCATQQHAGPGHAGQATDALVAAGADIQCPGTGQVDRAGSGQAATGGHRQLSAVDGGGAGIGAGTAQGDRRGTVLEQAAGTADRTIQGQRVAARQGQRAAGQLYAIGQGQCRGAVQRGVSAHRQRAGSQCVVVAQGKATGVERHATAEGIVAAQGLHAGTVLDQAAGTGDVTSERGVAHATESQRAATQRHRAAGHAGQRADGLRAPCTDVERGTGIGQGHRAGRGQASARADRQRAGIDGGATGEGVGAGQGLGAAAFLDQAACAADRTAERAVAGITDRQRIGAQVHRAVADQGAEGLRAVSGRQIEGRARGQVHDATGMQARACAQRQRTGIDEGASGVAVGAVQGQRRGALLGQRAGATQVAVEGEVVAAQYGQPAVENEVVGQRHCGVRIERGIATHRYRAGAQRSVVAEHQTAGIESYATIEGARAIERLHACTVLDQATGAAHHTGQSQVVAARQGQRVGA
ncbi:hypothetical protein G6F57_014095 [Rhizopus arrhizus]|nr:hypothetical protein G6F57_014095 [Rhizopus arrhizus]